jgi:general secretion pathway protein G
MRNGRTPAPEILGAFARALRQRHYNRAMPALAPRPPYRFAGADERAGPGCARTRREARSTVDRRSGARNARGFTLIEIMVVIVILGVLAALVVPSVLSRTDDARIAAAKSDLGAIRQALKLYRLDNQRYPTTEQGLAALVTKPAEAPVPPNWKPGGYLEKLPRDPWGRPYQYLNPGLKSDVDVFTYGADGAPGGTGADGDIGSWDL